MCESTAKKRGRCESTENSNFFLAKQPLRHRNFLFSNPKFLSKTSQDSDFPRRKPRNPINFPSEPNFPKFRNIPEHINYINQQLNDPETKHSWLNSPRTTQRMNAMTTFGLSALIAIIVSIAVTGIIFLLARYHPRINHFGTTNDPRTVDTPLGTIMFNHDSEIYDEENTIPLSRLDTPEPVHFPNGPRRVHFQRYNSLRPNSRRWSPLYLNEPRARANTPPPHCSSLQRWISSFSDTPTPHAHTPTISPPEPLYRHATIIGDTHDLIDHFGV